MQCSPRVTSMDLDTQQPCERSLSCTFPCGMTTLLAMNCRAKAEGIVRRFGSHRHINAEQSSSGEGRPVDQQHLCPDSIEGMKSKSPDFHDPKWVGHVFDIDGLRPIHVVTSEPTLHLCLPRTRHNTQASHSDPEQDSDMYYDFDLVSPEDGNRSGFSSGVALNASFEKETVKYCKMDEDADLKGAESGCVTLLGSPILYDDDHNSAHSNPPSPATCTSVSTEVPSSKIDLNAVSNILSSSFKLAFKSLSDEDYHTSMDSRSFPHVFKNRSYKREKKRNRQLLKSSCPICSNKDRHHSYSCDVRHSSSNSVGQDQGADIKSQAGKEVRKRRVRAKDKCRRNRTEHVVRTSSSDSIESSETSPINAFASPTASRYSGTYRYEDKSAKQIKQEVRSTPSDIADCKLPTYTHGQERGHRARDNALISASDEEYNENYITVGGYKFDHIATASADNDLSKDVNISDNYTVLANICDNPTDVSNEALQSPLRNCNKNVFEQQKVKHMEKFYKSLERKLPTKDLTYVDIEISENVGSECNESRALKIATNKSRDDVKPGIEPSSELLPFYVCTDRASNYADEQVADNGRQRCAGFASSQSEVASDNVRYVRSSCDYEYDQPTSAVKEFTSLVCDYEYSALPDANAHLCDSNAMFPPVMPKPEGQTKVKKITRKTGSNGVVGNELLKNYPDNDIKCEGQCPDSELVKTNIAKNGDNHINAVNPGIVAAVNTEVSSLSESLSEGTLPTSDRNISENNITTDLNSSIKFSSSEIDSSQASVRPKTYFNISRKSCKNKYNISSDSSNGSEIDSQLCTQTDSSNYKTNPELEEKIDTTYTDELENNISTSVKATAIGENESGGKCVSPIDDGIVAQQEYELNPKLSKYYDETTMEKSLDDCGDLDEIETLSESDDCNKECEEPEPDEDDIILSGKFKNVVNYSEKVSKISDDAEEALFAPAHVVIIDDFNLPSNEEEKWTVDKTKKIIDAHLISELAQLQLKDGKLLDAISLEVQPPSDDSARSSCERDSTSSDDAKTRIKRSSSLKCGKTPPGTPGRKKIVRFADVLGLDLADVRTFLEGVPDVPKSAFCDLQVEEEASLAGHGQTVTMAVSRRILTAMFQQPGCLPDFLNRVRHQKVSLENLTIGDDLSVRGIVRVFNMDFQKSVYVRYTFDHWRNSHEAQASYVKGSNDGFSDRFSFLLWGSFLQCNGALTFCIRYCTKGQQFWDNNVGANYVLQCYPAPPAATGLRGLEGRPQNDTNVKEVHSRSSAAGGSKSFLETPTTPTDPWTRKFF